MKKTFHTPTLIAKKRDGHALDEQEIEFLVEGYTRGDVLDYQMAAWAMAVYWRGMDEREATALTLAMAHSGQTVEFEDVAGTIVDKHSTGGVGDKVSLVLIPLVAASGLKVAKLSGRGLGHTGGTIDKLESIPGFEAELSIPRVVLQVNRCGIALSESTLDLAPADRKLYALRDVSATVGSLPLIASSIMSKKLAVHAHAIVLDVKVGRGALMKTLDEARALARLMVGIGNQAGRATAAVLSQMDQPLGLAVGNALEVQEAIQTLHGEGPDDLTRLCLTLGAQLLTLSGQANDLDAARQRLERHLKDGSALAKFLGWIETQGGDRAYVEDPARFPAAASHVTVSSPGAGYVKALNALAIGQAAQLLGAGRTVKGEQIDHAVGVRLHAKVAEHVAKGDPLATLYVNDEARLEAAQAKVSEAFTLASAPVEPPPLVYEHITP